MTVKSVSQLSKDMIIMYYKNKSLNQKELALAFDTSERTINRVLIEAGLLTPVAQLKADAYNVMQVLKKHGVKPNDLDGILGDVGYTTRKDVENYLLALSYQRIHELFYNMAMAKFESQLQTEMADACIAPQEAVFEDLPF